MKSVKKLEMIYNEIQSNSKSVFYLSFEQFIEVAGSFVKEVKKENLEMELVSVDKSGISRVFRVANDDNKQIESLYNQFINAVYHRTFNRKNDFQEIRISGCGMDMHWHLLFSICEAICTSGEIAKFKLNAKCSRNPIFKIAKGERVYL